MKRRNSILNERAKKDEGDETKDQIRAIRCAIEGGNAMMCYPHFNWMLGLREPISCGDSLAVG